MTKIQLEEEIKRLRKLMRNAGIPHNGEKTPTLTDLITDLEKEATKEIQETVDNLYKATGVVPHIDVTLNLGNGTETDIEVVSEPSEFKPVTGGGSPQSESIRKLVEHCYKVGKYPDQKAAASWIVKRIANRFM